MSFNVNLLVTVSSAVGSVATAWPDRYKLLESLFLLCASFSLMARIARTMELTFIAARSNGRAFLCVARNASYAVEIYYCSIGSGSQKKVRNIVNTSMQIVDFK